MAGALEEAARLYTALVGDCGASVDLAADAACNRSSVLLDLGFVQEARAPYEEATQLLPTHSDAEAAYQAALAAEPRHAEALANLATVLQAQGKDGAARLTYDVAVALVPSAVENPKQRRDMLATLHYGLGTVYGLLEATQGDRCPGGGGGEARCSERAAASFAACLALNPAIPSPSTPSRRPKVRQPSTGSGSGAPAAAAP